MELSHFLLASAVISSAIGGIILYRHGAPSFKPFRPKYPYPIDTQPHSKTAKRSRAGLNLLVAGIMLFMVAMVVCRAA